MNSTLDGVEVVAKLLAVEAPPVQYVSERGYLQVSMTCQGELEARGTRGYVEWLLSELTRQGWALEMDNLRWCG